MKKFLRKFLLQCVGNVKNGQSRQKRCLRTDPDNERGHQTNPEIPSLEIWCGYSAVESSIKSKSGAEEKTAAFVEKYGSPRSVDNEYEILEFLGEGSFGKVAKCLKKKTSEIVAVKVSQFGDFLPFMNECSILNKVNFGDPDKLCFVRNLENFMYTDRYFMVFEMLEKNLYEHMLEDDYRPLPMEAIRYITQQLLIAQSKLRDLHIIHGDLKLENMMLVNHQKEPYRIKIVDFGMSIQLPSSFYSSHTGTITYRAPEIMLCLPYTEAVDMWSIGCVVAEMLIGDVLYPGRTAYDQLRFIDEMQGPFPDDVLYPSTIAEEYFYLVRDDHSLEFKWRIKTPTEYHRDSGILSCFRSYRLENLDALLRVSSRVRKDYDEGAMDRKYCVNMIKEMLQISVEERILPHDALECNFMKRETSSSSEIYHDHSSSFSWDENTDVNAIYL